MQNMARKLFGILVLGLIGSLVYLTVFSDGLGKAPAITVKTAQGQMLELDRPMKPVMVTFWATTCSGCIAEMPHLAKIKQQFGDKFELVAVSMEYDPAEQVEKFTAKNPYPFSFVKDTEGKIASAFGEVLLTPTSYLIAPNGNIKYRKVGEVDFDWVVQTLDQMTPDL